MRKQTTQGKATLIQFLAESQRVARRRPAVCANKPHTCTPYERIHTHAHQLATRGSVYVKKQITQCIIPTHRHQSHYLYIVRTSYYHASQQEYVRIFHQHFLRMDNGIWAVWRGCMVGCAEVGWKCESVCIHNKELGYVNGVLEF